ncbi:hypothetical protein AVEN_235616-1 [Araneus ventricosus]|uniref:Reverse transcriptase domain-containing protein n=1 Tax=Araneus ventricosus TaxID=182803 RepID=A0A4Y2BRE2_ARAVE|nr:hypothetical protein AVEN_235616-1 [Araneus ventricosus]
MRCLFATSERVVLSFGVCSSPFLLAATINHLSDNTDSEYVDFVLKLRHSFYVDNCVTVVSNVQAIEPFVSKAQEIMTQGCFDLRGSDCIVRNKRFLTMRVTQMW